MKELYEYHTIHYPIVIFFLILLIFCRCWTTESRMIASKVFQRIQFGSKCCDSCILGSQQLLQLFHSFFDIIQGFCFLQGNASIQIYLIGTLTVVQTVVGVTSEITFQTSIFYIQILEYVQTLVEWTKIEWYKLQKSTLCI